MTTKPIGQGTGLGLSMVYGFAKQTDGHVRIISREGQGMIVKFYLPCYRGEASQDDDDTGLVPGLNGRQLAEQLRQARPNLTVLFMTGHAENTIQAGIFSEPGMAMMAKPFLLDA